jgi:hypothetical protein
MSFQWYLRGQQLKYITIHNYIKWFSSSFHSSVFFHFSSISTPAFLSVGCLFFHLIFFYFIVVLFHRSKRRQTYGNRVKKFPFLLSFLCLWPFLMDAILIHLYTKKMLFCFCLCCFIWIHLKKIQKSFVELFLWKVIIEKIKMRLSKVNKLFLT